jgi:predicted lipoprotein with Yx(FWY)xxD motif
MNITLEPEKTMRRLRTRVYVAIAAMTLAGCGRSERASDTVASAGVVADSIAGTSTPQSAANGMPADAATSAAAIGTATDATLGRYLTDARGRTLYMFARDRKGSSSCTLSDGCAKVWPPFGGSTAPGADTAVQAAMLGMAARPDSIRQTSYNGMPVYYYDDDKKPGDIEGQGKLEFGGLWYVVSPSGDAIKTAKQKK